MILHSTCLHELIDLNAPYLQTFVFEFASKVCIPAHVFKYTEKVKDDNDMGSVCFSSEDTILEWNLYAGAFQQHACAVQAVFHMFTTHM